MNPLARYFAFPIPVLWLVDPPRPVLHISHSSSLTRRSPLHGLSHFPLQFFNLSVPILENLIGTKEPSVPFISTTLTVRGHCPSGVTVTDRPSELIYMILVGKPILQAKWSEKKFYHLWNIPQKIPFDWPHLWYTTRTHPRGYPLHWVIPITDTPKRIPITLSETLTLSDTHYTEWYRYPEWLFLSPKVLTTHPRVYPLHWGTLFSSQTNQTLSDTHHTEWFFLTLSDTHHIEWFFLTLSDTHYPEFQPIEYRTEFSSQ